MSGTPRPRLSVCIVAMNEADNIGDCLRSADFADEWIGVDSHSSDRTREIATEFGARVEERDWPGHISRSRMSYKRFSWWLIDSCISFEAILSLRPGFLELRIM